MWMLHHHTNERSDTVHWVKLCQNYLWWWTARFQYHSRHWSSDQFMWLAWLGRLMWTTKIDLNNQRYEWNYHRVALKQITLARASTSTHTQPGKWVCGSQSHDGRAAWVLSHPEPSSFDTFRTRGHHNNAPKSLTPWSVKSLYRVPDQFKYAEFQCPGLIKRVYWLVALQFCGKRGMRRHNPTYNCKWGTHGYCQYVRKWKSSFLGCWIQKQCDNIDNTCYISKQGCGLQLLNQGGRQYWLLCQSWMHQQHSSNWRVVYLRCNRQIPSYHFLDRDRLVSFFWSDGLHLRGNPNVCKECYPVEYSNGFSNLLVHHRYKLPGF
jgi:hypothetical protein